MQNPLILSDQLKEMTLGDHLCLIYRNFQEQMAAILPYIEQGLERNEACIYIADDRSADEIRAAMREYGIQVEREESRGALTFSTKREAYLKFGAFDPQVMLRFLRESMQAALDQGFTGFRIAGEMTWALGDECGCDRLIEYEALLNEFFPGSKSMAICQYSLERFEPKMIRDVLRTHPTAILDQQVCSNLYFEPTQIVLGRDSERERVDWMISQLKKFHATQVTLQQAVQARDEFLSIASHELKTPLTSLKLQTQALRRSLKREKVSDQVDHLINQGMQTTEKQVDRLARLVSDLIDVAQINTGKLEIDPRPTDLAEVARQIADRFDSPIELDLTPSVVGHWDRSRMEQVITHLISNALKYGQDRPVRLEVSLQDEATARLRVMDRGLGIPAAAQSRIFDRFERANDSRVVNGLGLGLFLSKEIVEAHRGRIAVESQTGEGATFTVTLPLR